MPYILKEWSVVDRANDPYQAPETRCRVLAGRVFGHLNFEDGHYICTSLVVRAEGRRVWTKHSEYVLEGPPDEGYVKFLNERNIPLDLDDPFKKII